MWEALLLAFMLMPFAFFWCCCPTGPDCGECGGTAPEQYQLTVPSDLFNGGSCGASVCNTDFSGNYLVDYYATGLSTMFAGSSCKWESEEFSACLTPEGDANWKWRIETVDVDPELLPGQVDVFVRVYTGSISFWYDFKARITDGDCAAQLTGLTYQSGTSNPGDCTVDPTKTLTLEEAP